ncbi:MAG TPA: alpha/beta hydrolase [Ktedonobacterales bacterium]|jgi:pimeloyl-ACP methyl ester carboxylesterase|nr:alpha/beta hydrolase [Ktedonobacterales bacterium]
MSDTDDTNTTNTTNDSHAAGAPATTLSERGVVIEGQRIASVMSDGARSLLARAPLVILPEVGAGWRDYRAIMERFAASRRVFALDWPGFGASARPTTTEFAYTLDHLTTVFGQWLDSLGIARAVLLGHGLAAGVVTRYAVAHPPRTLGMAMIGPLGFAPESSGIEKLGGRALRSTALLRLAEPTLTSLALGPTTEQTRAIEAERRAARKQPDHAASLAAMVALWRDADANRAQAVALARQTRAPGLVIRGALDPLCPAPEARIVAEALGERGGLEVTLPEAGHLPHLQQPERFYQALEGLILTAEANMIAAN